MRFLLSTDYALRVLLYVGSHPRGPVPTSTIARAYGISADHLAKTAKTLTRAGVLRATRGAAGGVELAKAPHAVRVGEIVRLFEPERGLVECLREDGARCRIERGCRLMGVLARAESAFYRELDGWTLADLLLNEPQLVQLLRPRGRPRARAS